MLILDTSVETKLRRLYVALAMSREAAQHINNNDHASRATVSLLNVASDMLEKILDDDLPIDVTDGESMELLM